MARGERVLLTCTLLVAMASAGCFGTGPVDTATQGDDSASIAGPAFTRTACAGQNAFFMVPSASFDGLVPDNWSYTSPAAGDPAMLRVFLSACDEGNDLTLSTPMHPDAASEAHHDNPDVVIGFYSDDEETVARMLSTGVPAEDASFTRLQTPGGDRLQVAAGGNQVLDYVPVDPKTSATGTYAWPATYAYGTTEIGWYWGHENATTRTGTSAHATFGPGSPIQGTTGTPWIAQAWVAYEATYAWGTPPTEET